MFLPISQMHFKKEHLHFFIDVSNFYSHTAKNNQLFFYRLEYNLVFSVSCCISLRYASLLQAHNVRTNGVIRAKREGKEEKKKKEVMTSLPWLQNMDLQFVTLKGWHSHGCDKWTSLTHPTLCTHSLSHRVEPRRWNHLASFKFGRGNSRTSFFIF